MSSKAKSKVSRPSKSPAPAGTPKGERDHAEKPRPAAAAIPPGSTVQKNPPSVFGTVQKTDTNDVSGSPAPADTDGFSGSPAPADDPAAARTFHPLKEISTNSSASIPDAPKRGPGRPRKEPARGDAGKPAARPEPIADRPAPRLTTAGPPIEASERVVGALLRGVTSIEGFIAGLLLKVDPIEAMKIWQLSAAEMASVLTPATNVVNKHFADTWMIRYADEIELATALGTIMVNKVLTMLVLKNPQMLARLMGAGKGAAEKKPAAQTAAPGASAPRPPVPMHKPAAPTPRTTPERPGPPAAAVNADAPEVGALFGQGDGNPELIA